MAFGAKTALMFMLLAATVMAAHASGHYVSCKNEYCKPITVNNVLIGVNGTADVFVDDAVKTLECGVPNNVGVVVKVSAGCPLQVSAVAIVKLDSDIAVKVLRASLLVLLDTILVKAKIALAVCA